MSEENLEKKMQNVTNTQDSIQSLSLWLIHHKSHHKRVVDVWMKTLKKGWLID
jgi:regulator of Ty1 transposition protein 103